MRARVGKCELGARVGKCKLGARAGKCKLAVRACKCKLGTRVGGRGWDWGPSKGAGVRKHKDPVFNKITIKLNF